MSWMHLVLGDQTLLPDMSALESMKTRRDGGAQASGASEAQSAKIT